MERQERYVVAVDIGATKTRWGLVAGPSGQVLRSHVEPTPHEEWKVIPTLASGIHKVCDGVKAGHIGGIVIGVPGSVTHDGSIVRCPNIPVLERIEFDQLEQMTAIPMRIVRDLTMAALGEWHSLCPNGEDMVVMYIGSGIGVGIVSGGDVRLGYNGVGGEVGHWTVVPDGALCGCGQRGCLETVASGEHLRVVASSLGYCGPDAVTAMVQAWCRGSEQEASVVEKAIRYVSLTVANVVKLIDPGRVVLGGGVIDHNVELVRPIAERVWRLTESTGLTRVDVMQSILRDRAPLAGAYWVLAGNEGRTVE